MSYFIDEDTRTIHYKFPKEVRQKIAYVREKYRALAYTDAVRFHGLHLMADEKLPAIRAVTGEANEELQKIDPSLSAFLVEVPISEKTVREGKLYEQIYYAIMQQMSTEILNHIKTLKSEMPSERSRKTLFRMIESFEELNVLGDVRINEKINELHGLIDRSTAEIKQTIMKDLDYVLEQITKV